MQNVSELLIHSFQSAVISSWKDMPCPVAFSVSISLTDVRIGREEEEEEAEKR